MTTFDKFLDGWKKDSVKVFSDPEPPMFVPCSLGTFSKEWQAWSSRRMAREFAEAERLSPPRTISDGPDREGPRRIRGQMPERTHEEKESSMEKFV